ncbi:hypothetical protein N7G274_001585 [Stereocaulon virgatum]|uniref:Uncharacterized protein n=1 Tax=Stereocaulon virgatum TaxID=373712 RepID=A0ABR4AK32_9LECA
MKILKCSLLASLVAAAALSSSLSSSALAVSEVNNGTGVADVAGKEWPPAPWIIPIRDRLTLFIHSYGSGAPSYLTQNTVLHALELFRERILSRGQPFDYYPPTVLQYEGVRVILTRSRELEPMLLVRSQAAAVIQDMYRRTRESGAREITNAEITNDGIVIRDFELRFQSHPAGMVETS